MSAFRRSARYVTLVVVGLSVSAVVSNVAAVARQSGPQTAPPKRETTTPAPSTGGKVAIAPQFADAGSFSEGLAAVNVGSEEAERWGYIDKTGAIVNSCV